MVAGLSLEAVIHAVCQGKECNDGAELLKTNEALTEICEFSISRLLYGCKIDAGSIFRKESCIWLKAIYRRMAGKRSIRRP